MNSSQEFELLTAFRLMPRQEQEWTVALAKSRAAANTPKRAALHLVMPKPAAKSDFHHAKEKP